MASSKLKSRLQSLLSRTTGQAYTGTPREVPELNNSAANIGRMAFAKAGIGKDPQSLVTEEGVIPLPDEDELQRVRRRRAARRGGGRASTVLSDDNRLGG